MKILFDARVHLNYFSGISRYIICLLDAYAKLFPEDDLIVLLNPTIEKSNGIYKALGRYPNISFKIVDAGHMGPKNYYKMGRIIKGINPDVYHYPHLDTPIFTGNIPIIATVHDTNSSKNVKKTSDKLGLKDLYFKHALRLTIKHSSKVIFVSDSVKKEVEETSKFSKYKSKFTRIYNGLEADFNEISSESASTQIQSLKVPKPYLLYVGQIREHKNIARIIEGFKKFNIKYPNYNLIIIGHNFLELKLNEGNIKHFDKVSNTELKALYANCVCFLFPTLFEGFGFPILEAFSFGKPVVTTNYGATKEISEPYATLVDPLSITAISEGIELALRDKNINERIQHVSKFSWKENARSVRKLYLSVIN